MKIYFTKYEGEIVGAQIIADDGAKYELTTNGDKCGLWINGRQVVGNCDFDLCCSAATARARLTDQASFRCRRVDDCDNAEKIIVVRKPLF